MKLNLALLLLTATLAIAPHSATAADAAKPKKIMVEEFDTLRAKPQHVVLDVRTPEEFKAGHVPGATNVSVGDADFAKKIATLDKSKTYLVHCAKGHRSALATDQLTKAGFKSVIDFTGGFEAWKKAGKPVEKE